MTRIIAIEGTAWYSKAIECYTWSPYSHVAIQVGLFVWEATSPKVRRLTEADFWKHYETDAALILKPETPTTPKDEAAISKWLDSHVGDDYAENSLLRFLLRMPPPENSEAWVCSKFVFEAMRYIDRHLLMRIPTYKITPSHIVMSPLLVFDRKIESTYKRPILKSPHES